MKGFLAVALLLLSLPAQAQDQADTLRDALHEEGLPLDSAILPNLDKKIAGAAELSDTQQFVIAYYSDDGAGVLKPPLHILRFDRQSRTWQKGEIGSASEQEAVADPCFGAVLDVRSFGEELVIETHVNPSAGCVLVISKELKLGATLDGWVLGAFLDGTLLYHCSQVHFATVHPAEIAVFDSKARKEFTLFPPKAVTPVRQKLIGELREFYRTHQNYCNKANDPCNPQMFDSSLDGKIVTDEREHAVAFAISYRLQGYGQDESKPAGPGQVIYVCQNANDESKLECRELSPDFIKGQFGGNSPGEVLGPENLERSLNELLSPEKLKEIFP